MTSRAKLTVRLPEESLDFVKRFAAEHGLTVTDVLHRYLKRLQASTDGGGIHERVARVSGLVPADVDAEGEYHERLLVKHR